MKQLILTTYSEYGEKAYPFLCSSLEEAKKEFKKIRDSHRRKVSKSDKDFTLWLSNKDSKIPMTYSSCFNFCNIEVCLWDQVRLFELQDWFDKKVRNQ